MRGLNDRRGSCAVAVTYGVEWHRSVHLLTRSSLADARIVLINGSERCRGLLLLGRLAMLLRHRGRRGRLELQASRKPRDCALRRTSE